MLAALIPERLVAVMPEWLAVARKTGARWVGSRRALWVAFGVSHAWLTLVGVVLIPHKAFFDLVLYRIWVSHGLYGGPWPVFDRPSVYPVGALVPMIIPALVSTTSTVVYALAWCALVTALDLVAVRVLARRGGARGAWWWLAFLVLLGPIAMGRIDAIVAPIIIVALLIAVERPRVAAAALTACAWVKVAPGALLVPLVMIVRRPVRDVVVPAALVCAGVVGAVAVGGGLRFVASFLTTQNSRALEVEAVAASPWVLASLVRDDVMVKLNKPLSTWEIVGPGTTTAARALDVVLPLAVAGLALLLWRARSRPVDLLIWGSLAMATLLIVVNKVGSPQYIGWLAPPVVVGLAMRTGARDALGRASRVSMPRVAVGLLGVAALTQIIFPTDYNHLLTGYVFITLVLVVRNLALIALLGVACLQLARGGTPTKDPGAVPVDRVAWDEPVLLA